MAIIPNFFMNAVLAIGVSNDGISKNWIGSGFIVSRKGEQDPNDVTYYIITNKHVVNGCSNIYIRFNTMDEQFLRDYRVNLFDENNSRLYSEHPNESTDVIAMRFFPQKLIDDKSIWGAFNLQTNALSLKEMQNTGVTEGCFVYALGFPMNLVETIKSPICRLGCISRIQDAFVREGENPTFLVDAQAYPGNSGGPVISRPEIISIEGTSSNERANLIGILSDYITYRNVMISKQTGREMMAQEENSGLTIVHPVERIREVVDIEFARTQEFIEMASTISKNTNEK
jgi:S1-C subfamily serine protease